MTEAERLAAFVVHTSYDDLTPELRHTLKIHLLDALGCAIGALSAELIQKLRMHIVDFGGRPSVTMIGGTKTAPDRAAFFNAALVRYLDYNDSYLAPGETCHPSDTLGGVLAASEYAASIGQAKRFLAAGASMVMVESEGITENVRTWRTDAVARIIDALGLEGVMFEAADPAVFTWYVKNYGPAVNLFIDHSQIVQLEALRAGIWGTSSVWGRIVTFPS